MADETGGSRLGRLWRRLIKAPTGGRISPLAVPPPPTSQTPAATQFPGAAPGPQIDSVGPTNWFGPWQPLPPIAPPGVGGRAFDYQTGLNLNYIPRGDEPGAITFAQLRALADNLPELRIVIEKRKDQIAGWEWDVQTILAEGRRRPGVAEKPDPRVAKVKTFLNRPDRRNSFHTWLRTLLEDMLVVDAACIYPRMRRDGQLYSLDVVDGTTIKQLIGEDGRPPLPGDGPAYQQILHGVVAADFELDELIYLPRNMRSNRLYGYSPVEQIILTVNIALRRGLYNLQYYDHGSLPEGFGTLPDGWTLDQIRAFQDYFDTMLSGNLADRRKLRFMPHEFKYTEARQPPMKDQYDEWLIRIICAAFSIPPHPFVTDNARATAQTIQITASQEGVGPLKFWIKDAMDYIIQDLMKEPDLEFVWEGSDQIDPLEKAQEIQILVSSGIMSRDEARDAYGLDAVGIGLTTDTPVTPLLEGYKAAVEVLKNPQAADPAVAAAVGVKQPKARPDRPNVDETAASPKAKKPAAHKDPDKTARRTARKSASDETQEDIVEA